MADPGYIPGLSGITGGNSRHGSGPFSSRRNHKNDSALEPNNGVQAGTAGDQPPPLADDPTWLLVQALDRLRATHELRPVDQEVVRALRGARVYQEESRYDLPVLEESASEQHDELPPDQIG